MEGGREWREGTEARKEESTGWKVGMLVRNEGSSILSKRSVFHVEYKPYPIKHTLTTLTCVGPTGIIFIVSFYCPCMCIHIATKLTLQIKSLPISNKMV